MSSIIDLIITGGTIDKDYQETTGELVFSESHLPTLLSEANCTLNIYAQTVMLKDSLEMEDTDRQNILEACLRSNGSQIVITHGTDTMVETAQVLQKSPDLANKTIVLTGAMRPYMLGHSDASFNIGNAFAAVQTAEKGVYIAMNGRIFTADSVIKNRQAGIFESNT